MISGKTDLFLRLRLCLLRTFFNLLYTRLAWSYDLVAGIVSTGMWNSWVRAVAPYLEGGPVLELGHGPGHLQIALHNKFTQSGETGQIFGLDKSRQMGAIASKRLEKHGFQAALVRGDAQRLPFPDSSMCQLVATFPSEYIIRADTLEEVQRVLCPGGQLVVLAVAWITGRRLHQRAAGWLFKATGQAPAWDDRSLEPVIHKGFTVQVERVSLANSQLLILLINKPN